MPTMLKTTTITIFLAIFVHAHSDINRLRGNTFLGDNRRLGPIPSSKAIEVPCHNATSDCGRNGVCRVSGSNKFCHCDSGYSSFSKDKPCAEKGKNQLVLAIMQYIFGYTGGPAFALGWTAIGIATLLMCCCSCCCVSQGKENEKFSDSTRCVMVLFGILCLFALFGLWIYTAVKISTDCVDKHGAPCKSWRRLIENTHWEIDS